MVFICVKLHSLTADVRQPWTNYVNNGNEYLIIGALVRSENIQMFDIYI